MEVIENFSYFDKESQKWKCEKIAINDIKSKITDTHSKINEELAILISCLRSYDPCHSAITYKNIKKCIDMDALTLSEKTKYLSGINNNREWCKKMSVIVECMDGIINDEQIDYEKIFKYTVLMNDCVEFLKYDIDKQMQIIKGEKDE